MAPRKAVKQTAGETNEKVMETDDVSRPKRKKVSAKSAIEEGKELKQVRLPRAAKLIKPQDNEDKDADADGEMNKKTSARSNAANSKKAPATAKQTKATSKRVKADAESEQNADGMQDYADGPAKKPRARGTVKKAGMIADDEPEPKQRSRGKKNADTNNANHDDAPPPKKGRGNNKVEEKRKEEDIKSPAQKKGKAQKKSIKPIARNARGKKDMDMDKAEVEKAEHDDTSESIENGDKENDVAKLKPTVPAPAAKKGKNVRKKADSTINKNATKPRSGKAAPATAAANTEDSSEENVEEPTAVKPVKGRQKKTNKDMAVVGKKTQRKKALPKVENDDMDDEEASEERGEEKVGLSGTEMKEENLTLSSETSENELQESENDEMATAGNDSINVNIASTGKDESE